MRNLVQEFLFSHFSYFHKCTCVSIHSKLLKIKQVRVNPGVTLNYTSINQFLDQPDCSVKENERLEVQIPGT